MDKVAFYLLHGLEVRHFLLSGLLESISNENEVLILISEKIDSPILNEYLKKFKAEIIYLPLTVAKKSGVNIEAGIRSIRDARKRRGNLGIYKHFENVKKGHKFKDFLKGNILSHYLSDILIRIYLNNQHYSDILFDFVKAQQIKKLYLVDYGTNISRQLITVCSKQNVEINVFVNTLKSVFIDDFIPFNIHKFHTWNLTQRFLYSSANPGISNQGFVATGLPYHNFLRQQNIAKIKMVKEKYNLITTRPIIVYSLIFEQIFNSEHLIIEKINTFLTNYFELSVRPIIVLRRNPFEKNDQGITYLRKLQNIVIADHNWERNAAKAWTIQSLEGELEWRALLQLSAVTMNIPSMATVDSLVCGTPVVNIAFDEYLEENVGISHIINAPFVKEFEKSNFVKTFFSFQSLTIALPKLLGLKAITPILEIQNSIDIVQSDLDKFI